MKSPSLLPRAVIGGEHAIAAAGDDGLAIGGEAVGAVGVAIGGATLDGGGNLAALFDVEDGVAAMIAALAVLQRPAVQLCPGAEEGAIAERKPAR